MTGFQSFMTNPHIRTWGWALLNFLWQGSLVAATLKGVLALMRRRPAHLRYGVATTALVLMFCIPLISFWKPHLVQPAFSGHRLVSTFDADAQDVIRVQPMSAAGAIPDPNSQPTLHGTWQSYASAGLEMVLPWACAFWFMGAILAGIRRFGGLLEIQRLKKTSTPAVGYGDFIILMHRSRVSTPVRLLESARVSVPTVIGWLRPAVLLPSGNSMEPESTQALLAHELAHIRRHDYLVNLLQAVIEIVLFFHPAVWWVSLQVRVERECCCDDDAVAVCGDLLTYVRALSEAEHRRCASKLAVAISGTPLLNRIRRLTEMRTEKSNRIIIVLMGLFAVVLMLATAAGSVLLAFVPVHFAQAQPAMQEAPSVAQPPAQPRLTASLVKKAQSALSRASASAKAKSTAQEPSLQNGDRLNRVGAPELPPEPMSTQLTQGRQILTGCVYAPDGAVMPGVAIAVVNPETKEVLWSARANEAGHFEIELPQQEFMLQFVAPGFKPLAYKRADLGRPPLTVNMELGQISEVVTVVTAAQPQPTKPAGTKPKPIFVGGNVQASKLVQRTDPVYPAAARDENVEATVIISALIDEEGRVKDPAILSGHRLLNDAALEAVRQWRYSPTLLDGVPWPVRINIAVVFKLDR